MELSKLNYWSLVVFLLIIFVCPCVTADVMTINFEEFLGQDAAAIGTFYPGVHFEALSTGEDWIVGDATTGNYNVSSWPSGQQWNEANYWLYDYVFAWTSIVGDGGKISFDGAGTRYVELGYCSGGQLILSGYNAQGIEIASDSGPANLRIRDGNASGPGTLRVDAPSGQLISYVIIHDSGNFWLVDNITLGPALAFDKVDDVPTEECRTIDDEVLYTISWNNIGGATFENVYLIDRLPAGATFLYEIIDGQPAYDPNDVFDPNLLWECINDPNCVLPESESLPTEAGIYDSESHTITWFLDTLSQGSSGSVSFKIRVNNLSIPGGTLHNIAELWSDESLLGRATHDTSVCCWDTSGIIYTDVSAPNGGNGTSWELAFNNLDDAMERARTTSQCSQNYHIYCAQGTYAPTDTENGFVLPANVSVYGGFPTGGCDFSQRNPKKYETVLTGLIDEDEFPDATKVVTMGDGSLLDGVMVTKADFSGYGVYGNGVNFTLSHCIVKDNLGYGIYSTNSDAEIRWITVNSNGTTGLYHQGEGHSLTVENSWLLRNGEHGIFCLRSTPSVRNSIISESDLVTRGRAGIRIENPKYQPKLFNLTIANNKAQAIYFEDDGDATGDPNKLDYPDLQNSILFFNGSDSQISGFNPDVHANFCCIQDCNEPGTTNFNDVPGFAYMSIDPNGIPDPNGTPDPNNYHLAANSICIDRANPFLDYTAQVDIDGEGLDRKYGNYVDVGADEVYDCDDGYVSEADVYNDSDFNADGVVGLSEFVLFSRAWLSHNPQDPAWADPNIADPNLAAVWNPICNLSAVGTSEYAIDLADLEVFLEDWLWIACWKLEEISAMTAMITGGEGQMQSFEAGFMETEALPMLSEPELAIVGESIAQPVIPTPTQEGEESIEKQIIALQQALVFLEQIWLEEPDLKKEISPKDWQAFMDAIYQNLTDLQNGAIQIE